VGASARDPKLREGWEPPSESANPTGFRPEIAKREESKPLARDFSIVVGGPVYDFLLRIGLVRFGLPNVVRRIFALILITWFPLLALSLGPGLAIGHRVTIPLLSDFATYGRLLLTLPLLLLAEVVIDPAIRRAIEEFVDTGIVQGEEFPEFEEVLRKVQRLRDSWIPETVLLVLAFFPIFMFQHEWTLGTVSSWHTTGQGLTRAGWWYAMVSAPLLRFMIYRWIFRYFIWALLLWRIGRLNLHLMPTHPDRAAGLDFLSLTQARFGILFCALGCAFAGPVINGLVHERLQLASYKFLMGGFVVLCLILGLLPLMLLAPKLAMVRRAGLRDYGRLGNEYTEAFDLKWVHATKRPAEPLLGTGDIQSLADLGNSYAVVQQMQIAPITKRLAVQLVVQAGIPLVPAIILGTPTSELVNAILKMVV
jgi:hypothetical protein